jgi:hypothetical protein
MHPETCWEPCTRAPFRLLSIRAPRQAVLRTSSWLAPSLSPTDLATSRWRRRAMRPTDVCHPNELRAPAPRAFLVPHVTFVPGTSHGVLGSARHDQGTGRFTTSERPLRRIGIQHVTSCSWPHGRGVESHERGRFLPTALDATEPLTPLSRPPFTLAPLPSSRKLQPWPYVLLLVGWYGSEDEQRLPRSPSTPSRES